MTTHRRSIIPETGDNFSDEGYGEGSPEKRPRDPPKKWNYMMIWGVLIAIVVTTKIVHSFLVMGDVTHDGSEEPFTAEELHGLPWPREFPEYVMEYIPPENVKEKVLEEWKSACDAATHRIREFPLGGPKLRAYIHDEVVVLKDLQRSLFERIPYTARELLEAEEGLSDSAILKKRREEWEEERRMKENAKAASA